MKNKGKKLLAVIVAILFMLGSATGAYAYWAANFAGDDEVATATVEVGEGETVTTTVTVGDLTDGILVPVGITLDVGEANNVDLTFPVLWESDDTVGADAFIGSLSVSIGSVLIGGVDYSHLFTVTVVSGTGTITEDISQDIVINVEFTNEPADAAEYAAVAGLDLVVTLTFTVTP